MYVVSDDACLFAESFVVAYARNKAANSQYGELVRAGSRPRLLWKPGCGRRSCLCRSRPTARQDQAPLLSHWLTRCTPTCHIAT